MHKYLKQAPCLHDFAPAQPQFLEDVLLGLRAETRTLPSKYFYDDYGSQLFEEICAQDEYYLTRTELDIMHAHAREMAELFGPTCLLIEYGSGSSTKTRLLLDALADPAGYVPIDISRGALLASADSLSAAYPDLEILPVCADYTDAFQLPVPGKAVARRIAYFPGSTIGNFDRASARRFLRQVAEVCRGGGLLIGVDLQKDFNILHHAYNDAQGITARFNKHLLERINDELDADFQLAQFAHYAFYNPQAARVEMHLVSQQAQTIHIGQTPIVFRRGESIWTESSYKYALADFAALAASVGFSVERVWTDARELFSVQYLVASGENSQ
jgi:dimethylhistidine N-methyltransferase